MMPVPVVSPLKVVVPVSAIGRSCRGGWVAGAAGRVCGAVGWGAGCTGRGAEAAWLGAGPGVVQQGAQVVVRLKGKAALDRLCRRGGNADAAQNLIDLVVGDTVPQPDLRLLYIQVFQNTVNRIIGTFAWHGDSSL